MSQSYSGKIWTPHVIENNIDKQFLKILTTYQVAHSLEKLQEICRDPIYSKNIENLMQHYLKISTIYKWRISLVSPCIQTLLYP
jgi:hypothetical protein